MRSHDQKIRLVCKEGSKDTLTMSTGTKAHESGDSHIYSNLERADKYTSFRFFCEVYYHFSMDSGAALTRSDQRYKTLAIVEIGRAIYQFRQF